MKEVWRRCALGAALMLSATNFLSCMHELKLVSITVHPAAFTFPTPDPNVQGVFTALGNYIHPPDTRDITDKVTWKTDVPQLIQINGGVVSPQPGNVCGIADVSASLQDNGNLVIGYATVTVNDPTNPLCPGGSQTKGVLTVGLTGNGTGTVTSSPGGINCPTGACGAQFNVGDTIVLTATPNAGSAFGTWTGCGSTNGNTCSVLIATGSTPVSVSFDLTP
jgi:hypothetical protein